jgi:hypothetical protein
MKNNFGMEPDTVYSFNTFQYNDREKTENKRGISESGKVLKYLFLFFIFDSHINISLANVKQGVRSPQEP